MRKVVFIQGGGAGTDQEASVRAILSAAGVAVEFDVYPAGRAALDRGRDALPDDAFAAIRSAGVALKTKLLPPKSPIGPAAPGNFNVEFRRRLGLFASVRPIHNLAGLPSRFTGINYLLVREITEDLYAASEHEIVPGVVQSFKIVTEAACLRFFRFTFDVARRHGKKTVHCIHKANILKLADGLFLDCFRTVAKDFPDISTKELIVDNTCMQLVTRPQQFEILAAGNLYGDLLGDLGAGLVGGISATAAVNHGAGVKVYEAVYGAPAEQVSPGTANPLPLLLPAIEMVRDFDDAAAADRIRKAVEHVLLARTIRPADLGGSATTAQFTDAVIANL